MTENSIITSDKVNDWHWSGSSLPLYYTLVDALAPTSNERHVERIKEGPPEESHADETEAKKQ